MLYIAPAIPLADQSPSESFNTGTINAVTAWVKTHGFRVATFAWTGSRTLAILTLQYSMDGSTAVDTATTLSAVGISAALTTDQYPYVRAKVTTAEAGSTVCTGRWLFKGI